MMLVALAACTRESGSVRAATSGASIATTTSSSARVVAGVSTEPASAGSNERIIAAAVDEVRSFLSRWRSDGPCSAAAAYLTPSEQCQADGSTSAAQSGFPLLVRATVVSYQPSTWISSDDFTLMVTLDLAFHDDTGLGNWNQGTNTRFITFTRPDPLAPYRLSVATSP